MENQFCENCGNKLEPGSVFCTNCGTKVAAEPLSEAVQPESQVPSESLAESHVHSEFESEVESASSESTTEAASESVSESVATPASAQSESPVVFCTNCGSKLEPGTAFCTNCGTPVGAAAPASPQAAAATPQIPAAPAQPMLTAEQKAALQNGVNNFWNWILSAFKAPTAETEKIAPVWYGIIPLALTGIFGAITFGKFLVNSLGSTAGLLTHLMSSIPIIGGDLGAGAATGVTSTMNTALGHLIFPLIFAFLVLQAAVLLGGWLANFAILGDRSFTFKKALDFYGKLYVILLAVTFVAMLFSLLGVNFFAYIAYLLWAFIAVFGFMTTVNRQKLDTFYIKLLAWLANNAILAIAFWIFYSILKAAITSMINNGLGNL